MESRRSTFRLFWLLAAATVLAVLSLPLPSVESFSAPARVASATPVPPAPLRVRRNVEDLAKPEHAAEQKNLRHAFEVLIARSIKDPADPTGYIQFANFHNDQDVGPCDHLNDLFQGWHRAHLVAFENALRDADPNHATTPTRDVALPYWDWTSQPSGKNGYPQMFESPLADGKPNIFFWPNKTVCDKLSFVYCDPRNSYPKGGPPYPVATIDSILGDPWTRFGGTPNRIGSLEHQPHNFMHGTYVGSDMGDNATAAYDPIFWFFHTNIDRLMQTWQTLHQKEPCNPKDPNQMTSLDALVKGTGHWPPAGKVGDFICIDTLGYTYDRLPPRPAAPTFAPLGAAADAAPAATTVAAPARQGMMAASGTARSLSFQVPGSAVRRAYLELPRVTTPARGSYDLRVYLHPRAEQYRRNNRAFAEKYFAGSLVVFALRHQSRGKPVAHQATTAFDLNITTRLNQAVRTTPNADWTVTIVSTPRGGAPGGSPLAAADVPGITVEDAQGSRELRLAPR